MKAVSNRPATSSSRAAAKPREPRRQPRRAEENRLARCSVRESILSLDHAFLADPLQVARYCRAIFDYTAQAEKGYAIPEPFLRRQKEVSRLVRAFLVDSFVRWAFYFRYRQETLFLAVHLLDQVLLRWSVERRALELISATVLFVAAKFEEVKLVHLRSFLKCVGEKLDPRKVLQFEKSLLFLVDFRLTTVSPFDFLKRVYHATGAPEARYPVSCYLLDVLLYDEECSCAVASEKAVAVFLLTAKLCRLRFDKERLRRYLRYDEERVSALQRRVLAAVHFLELNSFQTLSVKYRDVEFLQSKIKGEYLRVKDI